MTLNTIAKKVYDQIINNNMISANDKVLVALSGGADSVFMLNILKIFSQDLRFEISAAHVNHSIRGKDAEHDQFFCETLCQNLSIPFHTITLNIPSIAKANGISEETAGREERYKYFESLCEKYRYNKIAVAHNMNDSVETLLINLTRGCSLNGLGGIKPINGKIIRPIIGIEREEIEKYLSDNSYEFCEDSTNKTDIYTRNKIRNKVIKDLKEINPSIIKTIYSNLQTIRDDDNYLTQTASDSGALFVSKDAVSVDLTILNKQHIAIQKRILYKAFNLLKGNTKNIEQKHIDILLKNHISGKTFNMPDGIIVKREFDKLIFYNDNNTEKEFNESIAPDCIFKQNEFMKYKFQLITKIDKYEKNSLYVNYDILQNKNLYVRNKKDGDKFIPFGMSGTKKVKQYFVEQKIPINERKTIPILCADDDIVAVIPYRISEKYKVTDNTERILRIQLIKE